MIKTYMVPMRDGTRLATDVRFGAGRGPWPVVLQRTPYGRARPTFELSQDYVFVSQDVRGRGDSEGRAFAFQDDGWGKRQDGFDTVRWILAQPWCNGRVGTAGASALGMAENLLAAAETPGVLAQYVAEAPGSWYHHAAYHNGVFLENLCGTWLTLREWPAENLDLTLAHPFYDDFWRSMDSVAHIAERRVNIPAAHLGGWFDIFGQGTLDSFMCRQVIAPNQWLIMGPWPHGLGHGATREVGELIFPPSAAQIPRPGGDLGWWFDKWLRGIDTGLEQIPRVQYYAMGACDEEGAPGNDWRTADTWPVPARRRTLYLATAGRLPTVRPPTAEALGYRYDPANPVPTVGGSNRFIPFGPMDQREVEERDDVLVFTTPRLRRPVQVTGPVIVRLFAASSARDTVFTAKLCDVYPDGRSMLIVDSALRAACRESLSNPSPLEPGRAYDYRIAVGSTSIMFNHGHRIRVSVSSSNHPRFAAHPNVWGDGKPRVAEQTVFCGGRMASALILPVVTE